MLNILIDQSKCDAETAVTEAYCILNQAQNEKTILEAWKFAKNIKSKQGISTKKDLLLSHKSLKKDISYLAKDNNVNDRKLSTMIQ